MPKTKTRITKPKPKSPPRTLRAEMTNVVVKQAAGNLLDAVGGKEKMLAILADSPHPKAQLLMDRLRASALEGESFLRSYTSVGLRSADILEMIADVSQARAFIQALAESGEVIQSLVNNAKDGLERHTTCKGTGWKGGDRTSKEECGGCDGTGMTVRRGNLAAQELYFEVLNWKKSGGLINIDARRQTVNAYGTGTGAVPNVTSLIKSADEMALLGPAASSSASSAVGNSVLPVIDVEEVEE